MFTVGFHANGTSQVESDDIFRFLESLKELKELRSQIHKAADYCEKSFLNSDDKAAVLDNTKEYLCRAVVTVVDHLGSVSSNLNCRIQNADRVAETQLRINCLKQKLDSCDQYNRNFTLTKTRWTKDSPRVYPRYISPPSSSSCKVLSLQLRGPNQSNETVGLREKVFKTDEDIPLFMYTSSKKLSFDFSPKSPLDIGFKDLTACAVVTQVKDALSSVAPKLMRNPSFHFLDTRKPGGIRRLLKSMNEMEIVSRVRRRKWEPSRFLKLKF